MTQSNDANIRLLEELQWNQWPALQTFTSQGWLYKFADGCTKRSNSVNPLDFAGDDLDVEVHIDMDAVAVVERQIAWSEEQFVSRGLKPTFKISPVTAPPSLDSILAEKGYRFIDRCSIQTVSLDNVEPPARQACEIEAGLSDSWLQRFMEFDQLNEQTQPIWRQMLSHIRLPAAYVTLYEDAGQAVACGLAMIDRSYVGLWCIATDPVRRNRGYGQQLLKQMLMWGREQGAAHAFLVVVANNAPAIRLYSKLGFQEVYQSGYRVKA